MRDSKFADRRIFIFIFCLLPFLLLLFLLDLFLHFAFTGLQALLQTQDYFYYYFVLYENPASCTHFYSLLSVTGKP